MKRVAVLFSGSSAADWLQLGTFLMAAVHEDAAADVLFRGEAVFRLQPERLETQDWGGEYARDPHLAQRLKSLGLDSIGRLLDDIRASGDVKYYVCSSSLAIAGLDRGKLVPWVEPIGMPAFLSETAAAADQVLTF